jgi:hypothetical protein
VNATLPSFLQDLLAAPPRAGEGVHEWLFRVSRQLHAHLPASEIMLLLEERVAGCGRRVPRNGIVSAVQNSLACAWQKSTTAYRPAAKWPAVNQERREAIVQEGGLADLWELSPVQIEDNDQRTEEIIDKLFPGNPLLCCGAAKKDFDTRTREEWRGKLSTLQLIVPSPMSAVTGKKIEDGKLSKHTLDNTGPRRFLVCEFDTGTVDEQAALLIHLASFAPMVCALHSGGKSLHGWFYVQGKPEDKVLKFFRYAVSLGADDATWSRCQFVRIPDGRRNNGHRQTVFSSASNLCFLMDNLLTEFELLDAPPVNETLTEPAKAFTVWKPSQFLAWQEPPGSHFLLPAFISKGEVTACIGQGGLGKSRLFGLFLPICQILKRPWCGIETGGEPQTWLVLGNENSISRFQSDLEKILAPLRREENVLVESLLRLQAITDPSEADLDLGDEEIANRVRATIQEVNPGAIVLDPLGNFSTLDISKPYDMRTSLRLIFKTIRPVAPQAAIVLIHHARTGRQNIL